MATQRDITANQFSTSVHYFEHTVDALMFLYKEQCGIDLLAGPGELSLEDYTKHVYNCLGKPETGLFSGTSCYMFNALHAGCSADLIHHCGRLRIYAEQGLHAPHCGCPSWVKHNCVFQEHHPSCVETYRIGALMPLPNQGGDDAHYCAHDDKMYWKSTYQAKEPQREQHKKESYKLLTNREKKRRKKLSKKGRNKKMANQAVEFVINPTSEFVREHDAFSRFAKQDVSNDFTDKAQFICLALTSLGKLMLCNNYYQVTAEVLSFLINLNSQSISSTVSRLCEEVAKMGIETPPEFVDANQYFPRESEGLENQSLDVQNTLAKIRNYKIALDSVPFYEGLSKVASLACLLGLLPMELENRDSIIVQGYNMWVKNMYLHAKTSSIVDLVFDAAIFAVDVLNSIVNGKVSELFSTNAIVDRAIKIEAMYDQYRNGTLELNNLTPTWYKGEVEQVESLLAVYAKSRPSGYSATVYNELRKRMIKILAEIAVMEKSSDLQVPAYMILFAGDSQIGKSKIMFETATLAGKWFGFNTENNDIWYPTPNDDYDSGYRSNINVVIEDDITAEKAEFATARSASKFIRYVNAIPSVTLQAELEKKGKIRMNHKIVLLSANNSHLNALTTMNYPLATYNRVNAVYVEVHPDYRVPGTGKLDFTKVKTPQDKVKCHKYFPYRYVPARDTKPGQMPCTEVKKQFTTCPGFKYHPDHGMDRNAFHKWLHKSMSDHYASGKTYINEIAQIRATPICPHCKTFKEGDCCGCIGPMEDQAFENLFGVDIFSTKIVQYLLWLSDLIPQRYYERYERGLRWFLPWFWQETTEATVSYVGSTGWILAGFAARAVHTNWILLLWVYSLLLAVLTLVFIPIDCNVYTFMALTYSRIYILTWLFASYCMLHRLRRYIAMGMIQAIYKRDRITTFAMQCGQGSVALISLLVSLRFAARGFQALANQGSLSPASTEEIEQRKNEINPWKVAEVYKPPSVIDQTATMRQEDFELLVGRNTVNIKVETESNTEVFSSALMVCSNVILIPKHVYERLDIMNPITVVRHTEVVGGVSRNVYLSCPVEVTTDCMMCRVSGCGSYRDIRHLFTEDLYTGSSLAAMLTRDRTNSLKRRTLRYVHQKVANMSASGFGSKHVCNIPTEKGDCGSPVFLLGTSPQIVGLHCAGDHVRSACFAITRKDIEAGIARQEALRNTGSYAGPALVLADDILENQYGTQNIEIALNLHERDVVNFTPSDSNREFITPLGHDKSKRFKRFSEVKISPLSFFLDKVGLYNEWGAPQFNANRNHAETYQAAIQPMDHLPEIEYSVAIRDYTTPIIDWIKQLKLSAKPLSLVETINGNRTRFMSRMPMNTSSGLGLKSPKRIHFDELDEEIGKMFYPKDYITEEFSKVESKMLQGYNAGHIFTSALKDEPTKFTKSKVRVFQVAPVTLTLVCRKYLLPILDVMYSNPLLCELAQGINCTNDEWHQLALFISSKSFEQCIEGDFSSYDARQSGQSIRACGYVFRLIAEALGYNAEEARMIETIVNEISYKIFCFNGSVFKIDGYMPSGVPVTIAINGITNALLHRIVFNRICAKEFGEILNFREHVSFMTMGDDSIGSTTLSCFNMVNIQKEMLNINMPYTDGHKNVETRPFFSFSEIAFCKRKFLFNAIVQKYVAPIDIKSILKSLHCYMLSATPEMEIVVQNVDGAIRELARHPKHVFEEYQKKILLALEHMGITHLCPPRIGYSYENWWEILQVDFDCPAGSVDDTESQTTVTLNRRMFTDYETFSESEDEALEHAA